MNFLFAAVIGAIIAFLMPHSALFAEDGGVQVFSFVQMILWFAAGAFLSSVVRFVGPKREHVITLLGTTPLQVLKTGICFTLPWPFGWTSNVVMTNVQARKVKVQIKSRDNLVFMLPVTIQFQAIDSLKYSFERSDPDQQMENLTVAAVRGAGNSMDFQAIYDDKQHVKDKASVDIDEKLASFGIKLVELVVEDPDLPETTAKSLNGIREAEFSRQAAVNLAEGTFIRMVGEARAETESLRLKGAGVANFRLLVAEGNAGAIGVMQGKLGIKWEEQTVGEGDTAKKIQIAKFINPTSKEECQPEELDLSPEAILDFLKIIDSNDAIRDAASKPGTVIIAPAGGNNTTDMIALASALKKAG